MIPPPEVTDVDLAFCGKAMEILPDMNEIPKEFKGFNNNKWSKIVSEWFYSGGKIKKATPKKGVDKDHALRAIQCVLGSFSPKHEHKMAGAAYLLSEWFEEFEISK